METDDGNCADFLTSLYQKGVRLWLDESRLHYYARQGVLTPAEIATLRAMKEEVVAVLKQRQAAAVDPSHPLVTQGLSGDLAPLTIQQEIVWESYQRGALSFLWPCALRISGALNADFLRSSLDALVRRHDSLRTRIVVVNGIPRQQVDPPREYVLNVLDLSNASENEKNEAIRLLFVEMSAQGRDPAAGPLFSARLLRTAADEHVLVWAIHHIISDAFSLSLMFRQLWLSYAESMRGQPSSLGGVPIQYPDYAVWQRNTPKSLLEKGDAYWSQRLAGAQAIRWPVDLSASGSKLDPAEQARFLLGRELTDELHRLCSQTGTTLGMAMLAACAAVVSRRCGQEDFILPVAVTGRDRSVLESMVGYCAQGLYLRFQLIGGETLGDVLSIATEEFQRALSHQDFGRAMALRRDLLGHTMFQWHPVQQGEYGGLPESDLHSKLGIKIEMLPFEVKLVKEDPFNFYHVLMHFWNSEEGIVGQVWGRPAFFARRRLERLAQDIHVVASQLARNPRARLVSCL